MDKEDYAWRDGVVSSLGEIKGQLLQLATERSTAKETADRLAERMDKHVEWNDDAHAELHQKVDKVSHKVSLFTGVIMTLQFILTLAVGVLALLK